MSPDDANALAVRYHGIWRGGPTVQELRTQFADADFATMRSVLTQLARTCEHPPSLRRIFDDYHATARRSASPPRPDYSNAADPATILERLVARGDHDAARTLARTMGRELPAATPTQLDLGART